MGYHKPHREHFYPNRKGELIRHRFYYISKKPFIVKRPYFESELLQRPSVERCVETNQTDSFPSAPPSTAISSPRATPDKETMYSIPRTPMSLPRATLDRKKSAKTPAQGILSRSRSDPISEAEKRLAKRRHEPTTRVRFDLPLQIPLTPMKIQSSSSLQDHQRSDRKVTSVTPGESAGMFYADHNRSRMTVWIN
jgi:hypothetical protein